MPVVFVSIWAFTMETEMSAQAGPGSDCVSQLGLSSQDSCWTGWSQSPHLFYLIAAPMLVAYAVSLRSLLVEAGFDEIFPDQSDLHSQHREDPGVQTAGGQHS